LQSANPYQEFQIKDSRRTTKEGRIEDLRTTYKKGIIPINYRPFDIRYTLPFEKNEFWINSPRNQVMQHFLLGENVGLVVRRQQPESKDLYLFASDKIISDGFIRSDNKGSESLFPLYLYNDLTLLGNSDSRTPNLNPSIVKQISEGIEIEFTNEPIKYPIGQEITTFAPIDLLDYIYAVLHSPAYREKYKEFLKIDFPRVPYPKDSASFWKLVEKGKAIRELHLLESPLLEHRITQYPIAGTNQVGKIRYENGKVYINESQYFSNVPQIAWDFYIGGYQPAQKWLKDRKDRTLNFEDINHYQHIIIALTETSRLMKEIDDLGMEW